MCCVKAVSIGRHLLALAALLGFLAARQAHAEGPSVTVVGEAQTVSAGGHGGCGDDFIPDAPARAFRTADGRVALIASYQVNRFFRGPDLDHLAADCRVVFHGAESSDPAAYDGHEWIAAPYTLDGVHVEALVHDEFWGHKRPDLCPAANYMACWDNRVTAAVSEDGGQTFRRQGMVAVPPYRYDGTLGRHVGYFNPSNIIGRDGWYYATVFTTQWRDQQDGNCLIRTNHLDDPSSWRGWDGKDFSVQFIDPYRDNAAPQAHVCVPVSTLKSPISSIVRHKGGYLATLVGSKGFYVSSSSDLQNWSPPQLLWTIPLSGQQGCDKTWVVNYPALLDPAAKDRNFEGVGDDPWLYFTRFWTKDCNLTMRRDLARIRVKISG